MTNREYPFRNSEYLGPLKNEAFFAEQALAGEVEAHLFLGELENGDMDVSFYYSAPGDLTMLELSTLPGFNSHYAGVVTDKQLLRNEIARLQTEITEYERLDTIRKGGQANS